jgi:predicted CoA-substrate-specific enzyme activase
MKDLLSIGIDCGSTACKAAVFNGTDVIWTTVVPTGWNPKETGYNLWRKILKEHDIAETEQICTVTGYGRVNMNFSNYSLSEITCHGLGADFLCPGVHTIIDIGGQDCKVIEMLDGSITQFQMNDRCAAGTGRFVEMAMNRLGITLQDLDGIADAHEEICKITSMCAVFAESEMISSLASGYSRESILRGVLFSVCERAAVLCSRISVSEPVLMTGGLAYSKKLISVLSETLNIEIHTSKLSQSAGAIGAAIYGYLKQ